MKFGAAVPILNEWRFAPAVLGQLLKVCDRVVVLRGRKSLSGAPAELLPVPLLDSRVELVTGSWSSEHATRNAGMELLSDCDYVFVVDSDEILSERSLRLLMLGCEKGHRSLSCQFYTYWKTPEYRIHPPESIAAPVVVRRDVRFERLRLFSGEHTWMSGPVVHHFSYVRTDDEVREKLRLFGHAAEVVPDWFERVWKRWDDNHELENLHPTHPEAYRRAMRVEDRELLDILRRYGIQWD